MDFKTFLEHFDTIAQAPNGIAKLRSLILDLAVRGKLVPQNPEDESAIHALERMQQEKAGVIQTEGFRAKNKKNAFKDNEYEIGFLLPRKWTLAELDDLCIFIDYRGQTPPKVKSGIRLITAKNVRDGFIKNEPEEFITEETYQTWMTRGFPKLGDVLFTTEAPLGKAAVVNIEERFALAQRIINLRPLSGVYGYFLMWLILSPWFQNELQNRATGMTATGIKAAKLKLIQIPLPPLTEQKRIVEKVDELMALCDRYQSSQETRDKLRQKLRESAIAALMNAETDEELQKSWSIVCDNWQTLSQKPEDVGDLRRSILQLAVRGKLITQDPTDQSASLLASQIKQKNYITKSKQVDEAVHVPFEIPSNWVWLKINDFYDVSGGIQKTPKRAPVSNYFPYLRVANVQRGYLDLEEIEYFELLDGELERWHLESGDLLIVEGNGSEKEIGRCAIWNGQIKQCVHQNHIIRARPLVHDSQSFTLMFLNSPSGMAEMRSLAITTSGLYSLSVGKIREILVPFPPLAERERIVAKVDELMQMCDRLEESLRQNQQRVEALAASAIKHLTV